MIGSSRQICVIKLNGILGCWEPRNPKLEKVPDKYKDNLKYIDMNHSEVCVLTYKNKMKCWSYNHQA